MEKVAKMPATSDYNRQQCKLLGAWCFGGKRRPGDQLKTLRKSYLDLLRKLQFDTNDTSDSALCGSVRLPRYFKKYPGIDLQLPVEFNL